ncbi:MAG: phenylalanine--tRNA ligase subunit beta [Ignavibacteria bacterium]|nr:phenylalanine--tRNA ligase subunit beta [Ignavibacteria bacterium]
MKISNNWLKEFVNFTLTPEELADALTMLGIEVESIHDEGKKFRGFYTGKVLTREKHPNADKLSVCTVTLGEGEQTIVCGAPNVAVGQMVVVATQGAVVPSAGFEIALRKIRGVESNGMICSRAELGVGEDDGGIWVLPEDTPIGIPFSDFLGVNDVIYEIGITPNRADCLSHLGIVREIAALDGTTIQIPQTQLNRNKPLTSIIISIEDPEKCPRYAARIVRNVQVKESPIWLKNRLTALGLRPRNAVVDVTNLVLMECGQPLHAFDCDTITNGHIIVKTANDGEKFTTLDSKVRTLDSEMLMICDAVRPLAIGGVMGGENSEITNQTTTVLIESAYFNPSSIRRTGKKLGISSDASYRFERGVDIDNLLYALDRAAMLIAELTGGTIEEGLTDIYPHPQPRNSCVMRFERARSIIGIDISNSTMTSLLERVGCTITDSTEYAVSVIAPSYRVDISEEIDLIEEVARMINYDNITPDLSSKFPSGVAIAQEFLKPRARDTIRNFFTQHGFNEILTYSFLDKSSAGVFSENPIELANPLGEEFSVLRPSMLPAMMKTLERNMRNGQTMMKMFDIGKTFHRTSSNKTFISGIEEREHLCVALSGNATTEQWSMKSQQVDFYDIKGIIEELCSELQLSAVKFRSPKSDSAVFTANSLEIIAKNGILLGVFGEVTPQYLSSFGLDNQVYAAEINLTAFYALKPSASSYLPVAHFPAVKRDVAFVTETGVTSEAIAKVISQSGGDLLKNSSVFDVFEGKSLGDGKKSLAFSLTFQSPERTLVEQEIQQAMSGIIDAVENATGAKLRE